jgi:hypothetical protein
MREGFFMMIRDTHTLLAGNLPLHNLEGIKEGLGGSCSQRCFTVR